MLWMEQIKSMFKGGWSEAEQGKFAFGFVIGFFLAFVGAGIGWLGVIIIKSMGG